MDFNDYVCGMRKLTQEEVIKRFKGIHGDTYDYSLVEYKGNSVKVKIKCYNHGVFEQTPNKHMYSKQKCPKCSSIYAGMKFTINSINLRNWDFEQPEYYKLIPLTKGKFAKVDNEDFDKLKDINWYINENGYALNGNKKIRMHRLIMDAPKNLEVDHINHDRLDNRKSNLRLCNRQNNGMNQSMQNGKSSIFKGVTWDKSRNKWQSKIFVNKKTIHLGRFDCEIEAAKAYDKKAKELFGEYSHTNKKEGLY